MPTVAPASPGGPYPKGPLGARFLALVADGIIAGALLPLGIMLWIAAAMREQFSLVAFLVLAIASLWQLGYLLARDAAGGAGFGKRLTGLVVVSAENGFPATAGPAIVRQVVLWALGLIPLIGGLIEPIIVLVDKDGRRLGDKAAKTQVVRTADVAARGIPVKTGKGAAIAMVAAALIVSLIGLGIGGVMVAQAISDAGGDWETIDYGWDDEWEDEWEDELPPDDPPATVDEQRPADDGWDGDMPQTDDSAYVSPVTAETAVDTVGNMLWSLQQDDVDRARSYASRSFQEQGDWFFYPTSGALLSFEVANVYQEAGSWTVEVDESWKSGPEKVFYFVIEEDDAPRVDGLAWDE